MLSWYWKQNEPRAPYARPGRTTVLQLGDELPYKTDEPDIYAIVKENDATGTQVAEITHTMSREDLLILYNTIGRRVRELMMRDHELLQDTNGNLLARPRTGDRRLKGVR